MPVLNPTLTAGCSLKQNGFLQNPANKKYKKRSLQKIASLWCIVSAQPVQRVDGFMINWHRWVTQMCMNTMREFRDGQKGDFRSLTRSNKKHQRHSVTIPFLIIC